MWVLLSLKRMDEIVITKCIKDIYNEFRKPIYLSINSYKNFNETYIDLYMALTKIRQMGIPISIGPQFLEEGFIINGYLEPLENMYFTTPGERVIWYLEQKRNLSFDTIMIYEDTLGIDPIIMKRKNVDYEVYFRYNHQVLKDIKSVINDDKYHFERINWEKSYDYGSKCITK